MKTKTRRTKTNSRQHVCFLLNVSHCDFSGTVDIVTTNTIFMTATLHSRAATVDEIINKRRWNNWKMQWPPSLWSLFIIISRLFTLHFASQHNPEYNPGKIASDSACNLNVLSCFSRFPNGCRNSYQFRLIRVISKKRKKTFCHPPHMSHSSSFLRVHCYRALSACIAPNVLFTKV